MIKYILFAIFGMFAMIAQWLCMNEVNGLRAIYQWPSITAFLAFMNPLSAFMGSDVQGAKLAIAVVSRLEHFERRNAIRNTWKRLVRSADMAFYFVMPEHPCPIDPQWRIIDTECIPWQVQVLPNLANEQSANKPYRTIPTGKKVGNTRPGLARDGLGFHIKFPVAIEQLGLSKRALNTFTRQSKTSSNLTLELLDALSGEILIQSNFSLHDLQSIPSDDGFIYKKVDEENLHKGFQGILRIRQDSQWKSVETGHLTCNVDWNKVFGDDGPIVWTSTYIKSVAKPSIQNFCPLVTLIFNIPDLLELKQICVASETQNKCQENKNKNLLTKLVEEMEDNEDDIYLAPEVVDSNSGAAKSVISFLDWLTSSQSTMPDFDHVLVTDDTSYVALDKVISRLHKPISTDSNVPIKLWRSSFDYNKMVKHFGSAQVDGGYSEAESNYFAPFYPPTPSAAGSVISRELVIYLTHNMNHMMHGFANIANSLSIWLAPIGPSYYDENDWFNTLQQAYNSASVIGVGHITDSFTMDSLHMNMSRCGMALC